MTAAVVRDDEVERDGLTGDEAAARDVQLGLQAARDAAAAAQILGRAAAQRRHRRRLHVQVH